MSDLLLDLVAYFISKDIATAEVDEDDVPTGDAVDVFRDTMPDGPDSAVAIYEYAGGPITPQIASTVRSIQIVARANSATASKDRAYQFYNSLLSEDGIINLTATRWAVVTLRQVPFKIKIDSRNRIYYGFNVGITTD